MTTHAELARARRRGRGPGADRADGARRRLSRDSHARNDRRLGRARRSGRRLPGCAASRPKPSSRSHRATGTRRVTARAISFAACSRRRCRRGEIVAAIHVPAGPQNGGRRLRKAVARRGRLRDPFGRGDRPATRVELAVGGCAIEAAAARSGVDAADEALLAAGRTACRGSAIRRATIALRAAYRRRVAPELDPSRRPSPRWRDDRHDAATAAYATDRQRRARATCSRPRSTTLLDVLRDAARPHRDQARLQSRRLRRLQRARSTAQLARACLTLAVDVGERAVTTIEGVAGERGFSRVQRALIDAGAIQCGFCTPGFVMALTALFARDPHPDARRDPDRAVGQPVPLLGLREDRRGGRTACGGCA